MLPASIKKPRANARGSPCKGCGCQLAPPVEAVVEADGDHMDLLIEVDSPSDILADWGLITFRSREVDRFVTEIQVVVLDPSRPIVRQAPFNAGAHRPAPVLYTPTVGACKKVPAFLKCRDRRNFGIPPGTAAGDVPQRPILRARGNAEAADNCGDAIGLGSEPLKSNHIVVRFVKAVLVVPFYVRPAVCAFDSDDDRRVGKLPIVTKLDAPNDAEAIMRTEIGAGPEIGGVVGFATKLK